MDLHVTNIAPTVTRFELRALFERVVPVAAVKLLPGGDALVTFDSAEDADKALEQLDGSVLAGKALSMRCALPRKEREKGMRKRREAAGESTAGGDEEETGPGSGR